MIRTQLNRTQLGLGLAGLILLFMLAVPPNDEAEEPISDGYFIVCDGRWLGPYTVEQVRAFQQGGHVTHDEIVLMAPAAREGRNEAALERAARWAVREL